MKLTDKMIKGLAGHATGNRIIYDDAVKGFGIRVTAAGAKAFVFTYWTAGRQRRYTIGSFPNWPLATARAERGDVDQPWDVRPLYLRDADVTIAPSGLPA